MKYFAALALACLTAIAPASAGVTTLAGSGAAGIRDGPAATATFLEPEGVAVAPNGDIYVADTAAQRNRRITRGGVVSTVAGSGAIDASGLFVHGGFADGPAAVARFNAPSSIAIAASGTLVVADRGNHCLRAIAGGRVSTFAGRCGEAGKADGARAAARFAQPIGLTFDARGTLYVADYGTGIRTVAADGTTATLTLASPFDKHAPSVTGVSAYRGNGKRLLFAATDDGVLVIDLDDASSVVFYESGLPEAQTDLNAMVQGWHYFGVPYAIAAAGNQQFVYTDIATNAVRFVTGDLAGLAAGMQADNEPFAAGAFRDGSGAVARVDAPMGIARRSDGSFVVADGGNRRIRLLSGIDFRHFTQLEDLSADRRSYRIVYIGNSWVSYDQNWDESVSGLLEKNLRANWKTLGFPKPPRVYPIQLIADLNATTQYVNTYLTSGLADMVVLQLTSGQLFGLVDAKEPANMVLAAPKWQPVVSADVRSMATALAQSRTAFAVSIAPLPFEISPVESTYYLNTIASPAPLGEYQSLGSLYRRSIAAGGVAPIDLFAAFASEERRPDHPALFGTRDLHLSVQGATLAARTMYESLVQTKPWLRKPRSRVGGTL